MPPRLDALTPLRFVAAMLIVLGHGAAVFGIVPGTGVLYASNAGVSFFFVLSGFVLAYNYPVLAGRDAVRRFLVLRFARIWPMHALTLVAVAALLPRDAWVAQGVDPRLAALLSLALLQAWVPVAGYVGAYNGPSWTLSVDLFLYATFPFLLVRAREAPLRTLAGALLLSAAAPILANAIGGPRSDLPLNQVNWYTLDHTFPLSRLAEFVLGIAAARAFASGARLRVGRSAATLVELAAIGVVVGALAGLQFVPYASLRVGAGVADWLTQIAAAPAFALLILVLAQQRGLASRLLRTRAVVHLGELSYAVYLMHGLLLHAPGWTPLAASAGGLPALAAFTIALVALAHLAWRFVETPARRAIVAAYDRRTGAGVRVPAVERSRPIS